MKLGDRAWGAGNKRYTGWRRTLLIQRVQKREQPGHVVWQLLGKELISSAVCPAHAHEPPQVRA